MFIFFENDDDDDDDDDDVDDEMIYVSQFGPPWLSHRCDRSQQSPGSFSPCTLQRLGMSQSRMKYV